MSKIIKLNNRYRLFQEFRFPVAVEFSGYTGNVTKLESYLRKTYGGEYNWDTATNAAWKGEFGAKTSRTYRKYYVGVRSADMLVMATLIGSL